MRGHLRKRGDAWQLIVSAGRDPLTGKRRHVSKTVRGTRREAEAELNRLLVSVGGGHVGGSRATFGELLDRWIETVGPDWSPTTRQVTSDYCDAYLRPALGAAAVSKITPAQLDGFYGDLRKRGGRAGTGLAPRTVRRAHNIVHAALEQGVRWGWIEHNAAARATPPKTVPIDPSPPGPEAVSRLLDECARTDPDFAAFVRLAAATGARRGELCGLRWSAFDLDAESVLISRSVVLAGGVLHDKDTKTHQARRIALDKGTLAVIAAHRERCAARAIAAGATFDDGGYVFSREVDGSTPWKPGSVTQHFGRIRDALDLDEVRLHDLRHYVATRLIAAGVPVRTVSGRLGHSNAATTLNVYSHFVEASDQHAADVLGALLDDRPIAGGRKTNRS